MVLGQVAPHSHQTILLAITSKTIFWPGRCLLCFWCTLPARQDSVKPSISLACCPIFKKILGCGGCHTAKWRPVFSKSMDAAEWKHLISWNYSVASWSFVDRPTLEPAWKHLKRPLYHIYHIYSHYDRTPQVCRHNSISFISRTMTAPWTCTVICHTCAKSSWWWLRLPLFPSLSEWTYLHYCSRLADISNIGKPAFTTDNEETLTKCM